MFRGKQLARALAATFICTLTAHVALAQTSAVVRGTVVAAADGSALPGATVTLTPESAGESLVTTTDAEGRFSFQSVRPGTYTLSGVLPKFSRRELRLALEPSSTLSDR
jgi:hypothetical protein